MTRKEGLPQFPYDYIGEKAKEYNNLEWMEQNQKRTTLKCLDYLFDPKLGDLEISEFFNYIVIDLGCGTGFSSEVLIDLGFNVIGIDILKDMLFKTQNKNISYEKNQIHELLLGSIINIPIRTNCIDFIISVSAYNFITHNIPTFSEKKSVISSTARYLYQILKKNGRMIIEFYPGDEQNLNLFLSSFKKNKFNGFHIKGNKGGQHFVLLKKRGYNSEM
ncbi:MAG: class I SAM-dependent methyltransferase [Promethearchaeota archaeon]|nr:MAG: class I SAM-dependent methyltransferase [Candidatus Lokiarchaeota archaeon]